MEASPLFFLPFFFIAFASLWLAIGFALGKLGGWHRLAKHYAFTGTPEGTKFLMQAATFGMTRYKGALHFYASPRGVTIAPILLFRFGHDTLFIPWEDITFREERGALFTQYEWSFAREPSTTMTIHAVLHNKLIAQRPALPGPDEPHQALPNTAPW